MIADHQTNMVFVADTLEPRFPEVFHGLKTILETHDIPIGIIPGTRDVWARDYLPIQVAEERFVQFRYAPDYLTGKYQHLRADGEIGPRLPWVKNCVQSEIVLDGGNVIGRGDRAIMTDKIFRENPSVERHELQERLKQLLELESLVVIPQEPFDVIGHADGMVRWLDEQTVILNDYQVLGERYRRQIRRCLTTLQVTLIEIPYQPKLTERREIPSASGTWTNFLLVDGLMIVPAFELKTDDVVLELLRERCPALTIEGVDCRKLAEEGGALNCVTWQFAHRERNCRG